MLNPVRKFRVFHLYQITIFNPASTHRGTIPLMPVRNRYIDSVIPNFYRRQAIDFMVLAFIDAYRFAQPSVTLEEAAVAFQKRYNIATDLWDARSIVTTYQRINKDLLNGQKSENS